ncbi:MAG: type II secretion system F family protein [Rhodospirillales bacterium]|nr:type II secretion system F family protein [Rhodospirillales bacterium]
MGGSSDIFIILITSLLAAVSFMAFSLPLLNKSEKKERYRSVIEKRRRTLFEQTKNQAQNRGKTQDALSARDSVAMFFKAQKLLGELGEKVRDQMLRAGIRSPSAPIKFIVMRITLPFVFMGFSMLTIAASDKEVDDGTVFFVLILAMFAGYGLPGLILKNMIQRRADEINITFPDALDMMLICVQGGIGLEQTVDRIADEIAEHSPTLAEELGILSAEMAMLNDRRVALQDFARRVGSGAAKSFATALIQAEQYGTSVSKALQVMSQELREQRMGLAEQKAAALPPKLTVPMIAFFLPVLFVIILGPAIIQAMSSL